MPFVHPNILEAENFNLGTGFQVYNATSLLGPYVMAPRLGTASMWTTANDNPGVYDLIVYYYDQNNGRASSSVKVDGVTVDSWTWNKDLGSSTASAQTYTSRVIPNVTIRDGSRIEVIGQRVDNEALRIDKVVLAPRADRAEGGPDEAFPGAEGFGSDTPGGRGGWIVKVTNLNDSGVGSLRWALEDLDIPRIVVFEVGGVVTLKTEIRIRGDVTVAGQTAPGEGITVRGAQLAVEEDNVIIRGLKLRPGDGSGTAGDLRDAISIGSTRETVENVVIDGNSFSWATDEVVNIWYGARNVTISNNIIAEGLRNSIHPQGDHSMGMLVGDGASNITIVNNLFMSNEFRNPSIAEATNVEFVNNYVYNYGQHALSFTPRDGMLTRAHVIGNYFERGPSSGIQYAVRLEGDGRFYFKDNISYERQDSSDPEGAVASGASRFNPVVGGSLSRLLYDSPIFTTSDVSAMAATSVPDYVLANVGARAQGLDDTDARLIWEAQNGRGGLKDRPPTGAYSITANYDELLDSDGDGVPNAYESSVGGRSDVFDPHVDSDRDGYSNIEDYINGLMPRAADVSKPPAPGPAPAPLLIEAETMRIVADFWVQSSVNASGRAQLKSNIGVNARADYTFNGPAGVYDLTVRFVDENDGRALSGVMRNGVTLDSWVRDKNLGSSIVSPDTFDMRRIEDVALKPGDVISLTGRGDGGEPAWMDYLVITPDQDYWA